jgi:hypothetical protein
MTGKWSSRSRRDSGASFQAGRAWNQIIYWSRLLDWRNETLTPSPNTIYVFPFFNTKEAGPVVLEIPPADGVQSHQFTDAQPVPEGKQDHSRIAVPVAAVLAHRPYESFDFRFGEVAARLPLLARKPDNCSAFDGSDNAGHGADLLEKPAWSIGHRS